MIGPSPLNRGTKAFGNTFNPKCKMKLDFSVYKRLSCFPKLRSMHNTALVYACQFKREGEIIIVYLGG